MSMQHKTSRAFKFSVRRELTIAAALALVALLLVFFGPHIRTDQVFTSSEVQFADTSAQGLSIVPASCPSSTAWADATQYNPSDPAWLQRHGAGECDVPPSPPPPGACNITAEETSLPPQGGTTKLHWNVEEGNPSRPACPAYTKCYGGILNFSIAKLDPSGQSTTVYSGTAANRIGQLPNMSAGQYTLSVLWEGYGYNSEPIPGSCDVTVGVVTGTGALCGLVAERHDIAPGESTNLLWGTDDETFWLPAWSYTHRLEMDNGIGILYNGPGPASGAVPVTPSQTTTYTLTGTRCFTTTGACGDTQTCRTTIRVGGQRCPDGTPAPNNDPSQCPGGNKYSCNQNNQCVSDPNGQYTSSNCNNACAPAKFSCNSNNQCVSDPNGQYTSSSCNNACGGGLPRFSCNTSNQCVLDPYGPYSNSSCGEGCGKCPEGQVWVPDPDDKFGGKCEPIECPPGTILQGNRCVPIACPPGQIKNAQGVCECPSTNPHCMNCTERYYCAGDNLRHIDTQCVDSFVRQCYAGCANNACLAFPPPDADFTVKPGLVRRNDFTNVAWSARHVTSCTVTGTNGDGTGQNATGVWNTISGTKQSSPILGKTTYTLTCAGQDESTLTKSLDVNIIPDWVER